MRVVTVPVRLFLFLIPLAFLGAGCSDSTEPGPQPTLAGDWLGTFAATGATGALSLRLDDADGGIRGELVLQAQPAQAVPDYVFVRGSLSGDRLRLELDTDRVDYRYTLEVVADVGDDGGLTGSLACSLDDLAASFSARLVPRGSLHADVTAEIPDGVSAIVFVGERLWLSTTGTDYVRLTPAGAVADTVSVLYGPYHWTSSALCATDDRLLGFLPRTIQVAGDVYNVSEMFEFDEGGIRNEFALPHRTGGLAHAGGDYWSLAAGTRTLYRFDLTGAILDSLEIEVPDPCHLEHDGTSFWTVSWYTQQLYELDATGNVVAVYDPPLQEPRGFPSGLAADATGLWLAHEPGLRWSRVLHLVRDS